MSADTTAIIKLTSKVLCTLKHFYNSFLTFPLSLMLTCKTGLIHFTLATATFYSLFAGKKIVFLLLNYIKKVQKFSSQDLPLLSGVRSLLFAPISKNQMQEINLPSILCSHLCTFAISLIKMSFTFVAVESSFTTRL